MVALQEKEKEKERKKDGPKEGGALQEKEKEIGKDGLEVALQEKEKKKDGPKEGGALQEKRKGNENIGTREGRTHQSVRMLVPYNGKPTEKVQTIMNNFVTKTSKKYYINENVLLMIWLFFYECRGILT